MDIETLQRFAGMYSAHTDLSQASQRLTPVRGAVSLSRREPERDACSSIRGKHVNLGCTAAAEPPDELGAVVPAAPGPSVCTSILVPSIETALSLMRTFGFRWRWSKTRSSTPFFDQRFIRV